MTKYGLSSPGSHLLKDKTKSNRGFDILFNSQDNFGTGPHHCHLWESNSHIGNSLWLDAKPANPRGY